MRAALEADWAAAHIGGKLGVYIMKHHSADPLDGATFLHPEDREKAEAARTEGVLARILEVLGAHTEAIYALFDLYACLGSGDVRANHPSPHNTAAHRAQRTQRTSGTGAALATVPSNARAPARAALCSLCALPCEVTPPHSRPAAHAYACTHAHAVHADQLQCVQADGG